MAMGRSNRIHGTLFGQIGRGKIDGNGEGGKLESGGNESAAYPILALFDGGFRQTDYEQQPVT